ncbi:hypothetical protein N9L18_00900 [Candidatus Pacebacteria bacterium]|nr:hypothetical protein [Candidatus Paceibacterota bacterium]
MKKSFYVLMILALVFTAVQVSAQEMGDEVMVDAETNASTTMDNDSEMNDEEMMDDNEMGDDEEEISSEDISEILDDIEELSDENIDSPEDLEGEVLLVTDEHVVIKTAAGQTLKVNKDTYSENRPGSHRRDIQTGDTVITGNLVVNGNETSISASAGKRTITSSTKVYKNGKEVSVSDLGEGDEVVAILDEEGDLVSLEVIDDGGNALPWIVLIIVVALIAGFKLRKKVDKTV